MFKVVLGYCAINPSAYETGLPSKLKYPWIGVVSNDIFCEHSRATSDEALVDAKELSEKLYGGNK